MRISWSTLLGIIVLVATVSYSLAEEITLTTYYPSPRGVYNELQANIYRDFGDPPNRFLDATGTSQLASVQFFGSLTLDGRSISRWEETLQALPSGVVLMFDAAGCPAGYTPIVGVEDVGRFPMIANVPDGPDMRGGSPTTDEGDALTVAASGGTNVAAETHTHTFMPRYRNFVFCQRD